MRLDVVDLKQFYQEQRMNANERNEALFVLLKDILEEIQVDINVPE